MTIKKIIFITGPTAVGKSDVAYCLSKKIDGEIISCDSMQVYKEINIISNKPSVQILSDIPHHLLDVVSVSQNFDVAQYNILAQEAIKQVLKRGRVPIITGGSGLYMQVILDGIFDGSPNNFDFRQELIQEAQDKGNQFIYEKLKKEDPLTAQKLHPNDVRRIVRALEVKETTGIPLSQRKEEREGIWGKYDIKLYCLNMERQRLYNKINNRVDQMFKEGLLEEIKELKQYSLSLTVQYSIGFREIDGFINGAYDLERAKELMKQKTRNFAKRQLTWFRKEKRLNWLNIEEDDKAEDIADKICRTLN